MTLHEILVQIKTDGPMDHRFGICDAVRTMAKAHELDTSKVLDEVCHLFTQWPEFSGDSLYPIADPASSRNPCMAYLGNDECDMWNPNHPYGAARLRLLDFLIERTSPQ